MSDKFVPQEWRQSDADAYNELANAIAFAYFKLYGEYPHGPFHAISVMKDDLEFARKQSEDWQKIAQDSQNIGMNWIKEILTGNLRVATKDEDKS